MPTAVYATSMDTSATLLLVVAYITSFGDELTLIGKVCASPKHNNESRLYPKVYPKETSLYPIFSWLLLLSILYPLFPIAPVCYKILVIKSLASINTQE
ncbi:MAG: hypothetical protein RM049_02025 [Nostoc sp. DedQUE04]|uniref:hypothetical protein n=1 Tax=Nostoc sp. DedQUE04 TaxID=3075390 RepID=UPI002AD2EF31|nr:hypothetical protein [Nostoc sp. DedQUE04]MDZ8134063.1 hypothetical protein [Nostoc sp. DedQUE04]